MATLSELKDESKLGQWSARSEISIEGINTGALCRIADATEVMAKNYNDLLYWKEYYKELAESRMEYLNRERKLVSSLRGVITRMKNKNRAK